MQTDRLMLRPLEADDITPLHELAGDRRVAEGTLNIPHPYEREQAVTFVRHAMDGMMRGDQYTLAIALRDTDQLIGVISMRVREPHQSAEIGYWVGVPYWNEGYTTEAARRLLRFAFEYLKLNRVYAIHFVDNPASGRVMQKIGMRHEGTLRQHFYRCGEFKDCAYYGILRSEFPLDDPDET
ncbi:MAG: GNAT family N-acetyltransferase [Chloroflexota bacterium]